MNHLDTTILARMTFSSNFLFLFYIIFLRMNAGIPKSSSFDSGVSFFCSTGAMTGAGDDIVCAGAANGRGAGTGSGSSSTVGSGARRRASNGDRSR